ncbi:MAG: T9SS type A sorting domain-containing protein [Chitinophagaceae bacterium]|nr:T9SS type A sorting domain-containing protein [Chitinophagaceae bacterium]
MKPINFLVLFLLPVFVPALLFGQTIYIDNGTSTSYTLQTGDSLYIKQGTFTGSITNWSGGGKVTVAAGATLKPSSVNGLRGPYIVYGTAVFSSFDTEAGFGLNNYGSVTINNASQVNGSGNQVWINNIGAVLTFKSSFAINADNTSFINNGDVSIASNFNVWGNATISNKKSITTGGSFSVGKGQITNEGLFSAGGSITIGGSTSFTNTCRTIAQKGFTINSGTLYNNGLLWAAGNASNSTFTNNGNIINTGNSIIKTVQFTNWGNITGNGYLYILGKSTTSGTVGTSGTTSDVLSIYTVNRTKTNQIFDDQWGTVYPSAVYAQFPAPDTTNIYPYSSCSSIYSGVIILPVTWNDFSVSISAGVPALQWTAQYNAGTYFEVERSNNGLDFTVVAGMADEQNSSTYYYNDRALPASHPSVVYYRIRATEPDGTHKYTGVKSVRFGSQSSPSLQTWPNPFGNQLNVSFKSNQKAVLTIKIYNMEGQVQVVKTAAVNSGSNTIAIAEVNRLTKGIYIVSLSADNGVIASSKIIKQ